MAENTIELKNLRSMSGMNFYIPDYQRGYRWSASEAEQMLNDFKEFCKRKKDEGEFYCLQPIVVKKKSWIREENGQSITIDGYEVIDGQQRLTTLYILLKCVEQVREILYDMFDMYTINYQTRLEFDSQQFLENINKSSEDANGFIDFYYMKTAYNAMTTWLKGNNDYRNKIVATLMELNIDDETGKDKSNNIRVIWYEVADEEKATSIDIFTRLNIGKIPLTNAELIKALLLCRGNFSNLDVSTKQLQISSEWNQIEQKLQDDSFWHFLYSTTWPFKYENRIEFIFDLMKNRTIDAEFYFTFKEFNKELEALCDNSIYPTEQSKIEYIWLEIKKAFQTFEEWYEDHTLYHYIGFLIEYGADINELMTMSLEMNKKDFLSKFIKEKKIKELLKGIKLSDLNYGDKDVKKVLLLFNIHTVLQSNKSDMRFPFDKYKQEMWDIEHISSQTDKRINNNNQRWEWLNDMLEFFIGSNENEKVTTYIKNLKAKIDELETKEKDLNISKSEDLAKKKSELNCLEKIICLHKMLPENIKKNNGDTEFEEAFADVQKYVGEDNLDEKDNINNLTLLDVETNRGYGNSFFPIKRKWIIENDKRGIFVPIVTKNVFLKYYSRKGDNLMYWTKSDADDYYEAMREAINEYIKQE